MMFYINSCFIIMSPLWGFNNDTPKMILVYNNFTPTELKKLQIISSENNFIPPELAIQNPNGVMVSKTIEKPRGLISY